MSGTRSEPGVNTPEYLRLIKTDDPIWDSFIHLASVGDMVHRYFSNRLARIGLTRPKFTILYNLRAGFGTVTPSFISKRIPRAKHTISKAITELENDNMVERRINPKNRRSILISLTEKGEQKADEAIAYARLLSREIMTCINNNDLEALDSYLAALRLEYLTKMKDV